MADEYISQNQKRNKAKVKKKENKKYPYKHNWRILNNDEIK